MAVMGEVKEVVVNVVLFVCVVGGDDVGRAVHLHNKKTTIYNRLKRSLKTQAYSVIVAK